MTGILLNIMTVLYASYHQISDDILGNRLGKKKTTENLM